MRKLGQAMLTNSALIQRSPPGASQKTRQVLPKSPDPAQREEASPKPGKENSAPPKHTHRR